MPRVKWAGILSMTFCAFLEAHQAKVKTDYTEWNSWTGFPEGAWVTIEKDFRGQSKTSFTLTLTKKTADALTVKQTDEPKPKVNVRRNGVRRRPDFHRVWHAV